MKTNTRYKEAKTAIFIYNYSYSLEK